MRIVVKIGSQVLSRKDGTLDTTRMSALTDQVATLHRQGIDVIMVSSGAVASGRKVVHPLHKIDAVEQRQLYSAVGQAILINKYYSLFREHDIICGQVLTTKESFSDRRHYLNQQSCMEVMLQNGIIPIVNENDTISVTELMFTDNDELSGLIATMMNADLLIMLSNVDGIYKGNPAEGAERISKVLPHEDFGKYISSQKSTFGRGGMRTKYHIASKVAEEGIAVVIANGKRENVLEDIIHSLKQDYPDNYSSGQENQPDRPYTLFIPEKQSSAVKKWIAHSEGFAKGELHINQGCLDALTQGQACSLLPIGVETIIGEFEAGDIVRIIGPENQTVGVGRIYCNSQAAQRALGKRGQKPLIHYDYLYLET